MKRRLTDQTLWLLLAMLGMTIALLWVLVAMLLLIVIAY